MKSYTIGYYQIHNRGLVGEYECAVRVGTGIDTTEMTDWLSQDSRHWAELEK